MGSTPRAHLAYGYDLGSPDDFKAAERTEDGSPNLPGLAPYPSVWSFLEHVDRQFPAAGVVARTSGSEGSYGLVLIVDDSQRSVDWDEVMTLDLNEMDGRPSVADWNTDLAEALTALGVTPFQEGPCWLVFPSYG
ncbi:hypothetical protein FHR83_006817 [Actinoplanes campanulatus]|uniref:Uncharacterized protein n=1 Tax=Actinoplanes campanulatus TaxID=113559 RepID=A0A7W5AN09_9ACTN|nr:hypothetical protein [Actinoplanes campanulatus]MBB3099111.1 hypothetical protein [Actinoplanes campanulatus]GGN38984.1 hypothetical protein GCM10010109_66420 [Actinoplanes campanulatus]GID40267.1 hypothetical protein Aca09nite_67730 [Actinoplanes campanulatus]